MLNGVRLFHIPPHDVLTAELDPDGRCQFAMHKLSLSVKSLIMGCTVVQSTAQSSPKCTTLGRKRNVKHLQ